jgi:IS5 family transposase
MENLVDFALRERYEKVKTLRPWLEEMKDLLDWNAFLSLFPDKETTRGRPEFDRILKLKILFLQAWYTISDEEVEFQINDRLSFQQFLGFPAESPDYSTIWRFREYLTENDIAEKLWLELQRQIDQHHVVVEPGVIQDARFVHADPGKTRSGKEGRGREAKTSRSRDGTWTKKNRQSHFGFKLHTKVQRGSKFITELAVTTASTHDNKVDLASTDDIMYRDRGYTGTPTRARGNASMKRGKLTIHQQLRNDRISKKRCQGEHPYATMSRSFKAGTTKLTTIARVYVQQIFVCAAYNLHRLRFLLSTHSESTPKSCPS